VSIYRTSSTPPPEQGEAPSRKERADLVSLTGIDSEIEPAAFDAGRKGGSDVFLARLALR